MAAVPERAPDRVSSQVGVPAAMRTWTTGGPVVAGVASSAVSIVVGVLAMPLYLRFLGAEAFGVLGFILVMQAAALALDAGLGVSVTRLLAQATGEQRLQEAASLVRGLERAALLIAVGIAATLALLAPAISSHWLNLATLPASQATQANLLAALAIGLRWPVALYQGVLIGRQRIGVMSLLTIGVTLLGAGGGVVLAASGAGLRAVVGWLALTALVHLVATRLLALGCVGPGRPAGVGPVTRYLREASAAGGLSLVGLLLMQMDKLVLSRLLPVAEFGYYTLASLVATSLYAVVMAVFNVVYPQLARRATADATELVRFYRRASLLLCSAIFPLAAALGTFGHAILLLWTGDAAAAAAGAPVLMLLAFATALHGAMFLPYALKLALGASKLAFAISVALLMAALPITLLGAWRWGATGTAAGWLCLHAIYLVVGSFVTHRRLLPGVSLPWLLHDVAAPLVIVALVVSAAEAASRMARLSSEQAVVLAGACVITCWVVQSVLSPRLRSALRALFEPAA